MHRRSGRPLQGAPGQGPCILVHPLENIQEVQMAADRVSGGGGTFWDEGESVVWSGTEVPFLLTYNAVSLALAMSPG